MPSTNGSAPQVQIPLVDVSCVDQETGLLLVEAVAKYGFAFIRGEHVGLDAYAIDNSFSLVRPCVQAPKYSTLSEGTNRFSS